MNLNIKLLLLALLVMVAFSFAWWDASYSMRMPINCTSMADYQPMEINGSLGFSFNGTSQHVITNCNSSGTLYLYYNNDSSYAIGNDTSSVPYLVRNGNVSSYLPQEVFNYTLTGVTNFWSLNASLNTSAIDWASGNNMTNHSANVRVISTPYGDSFQNYTDDASYFSVSNPSKTPRGNNDFTTYALASSTQTASAAAFGLGGNGATGTEYRIMTINTPGAYCAVYGYDDSVAVAAQNINTIWFVSWNSTAKNIIYGGANVSKTKSTGANSLNIGSSMAKIGQSDFSDNSKWIGNVTWVIIYNSTKTALFTNQTTFNTLGMSGYGTLGTAEAGVVPTVNVTISSPLNQTYNTANIVTNFTATGSDLAYLCNVTANGAVVLSNQAVLNATSYNYTQNYTANGNWQANATCANSSTNSSSSAYFKVDTQAPSIILNAPINSVFINQSNILLNSTATDNLDLAFQCMLNGSWMAPSSCYQETANVSTACGGLSSGSYTIVGSLKFGGNSKVFSDGDWATNGILDDGAEFIVNYTIPSGTTGVLWAFKDTPEQNFTIPSICLQGATLAINISENFPGSGFWYKYCWNGTDWDDSLFVPFTGTSGRIHEEAMWWNITNIITGTITTNVTYNWNQTIPDGPQSWNVSCTDSAGNSNVSNTENFTIDTIPPSVSIISPANSTYISDVILVNLSASDANLGTTWFFNGTDNQTYTSPINITYPVGNSTLTMWANDSAGNTASADVTFTFDNTTIPELLYPPDGAIVNGSVNPVWKCYGVYASYWSTISISNHTGSLDPYISLNDTNITDTFGLSNKLHQWDVTCSNDTAASTSATWSFLTDSSPPTISFILPVNTTYNATVPIEIDATDDRLDSIWFFDGFSNQTYTGPFNDTYPTGTYTIQAWANDTVGNINTTSITFTVDASNPSVSIQSPLNQSYNSTSLYVNLSAADANGIDRIWFDWYGMNQTYPGPALWTFGEGDYALIAWANDTLGNTGNATVVFTVDSIAPAISIISPANVTWPTHLVTIAITAGDTHLNSTWFDNGTANTTYTGALQQYFQDGFHTITAYANDTFGNINSTAVSFTVDTTAPSITLHSPANSSYNYSAIMVNISAADVSGIDTIWYTGPTSNLTYTSAASIPYADGTTQFTAWANDTLGNVGSATVYFTVDTEPPIVIINAPTNTIYTANPIAISLYANDPHLDKIWFSNDTANTTYTVATNQVFQDGFHTLVMWANDTFGNTNSTNVTFLVDTKPPVITLVAPADGYTSTGGSVNFKFKAVDARPTLACDLYMNGSIIYSNYALPNNTIDTYVQSGVSWGSHSWYVICDDQLGNNNQSETRYFTIIDNTPPTMAYISPTDADGTTRYTLTDSFVAARVTATDTMSGLGNIKIFIYQNGMLMDTHTTYSSPNNINWSSLPPATYRFYASATDNAGNTAYLVNHTVTILQAQPPQVVITSPMADTSGNSVSATCSGSSSSYDMDFYLDTNYVSTQTCANTAQCTFTYPLQTCHAMNISINCSDILGFSGQAERHVLQIPDYSQITPQTGATVSNTTSLTFGINYTCTPSSSFIQIATVPYSYPMVCVGLACTYTNSTWLAGYHLWSITTVLAGGGNISSPSFNFFVQQPQWNMTTNITFNKTYTYSEFTGYVSGFYEDYGVYFLGILAYALAWLVTQRYPQTMIAGGLGMLVIFFITWNPISLAISIVSVVVGLAYKYSVG
jgi:hypothetical protein